MSLARFNLRFLIGLLTVGAVLAAMGGPAYGGRAWAVGMAIAVLSVAVMLLVHAAFIAMFGVFGRFTGEQSVTARTSRGGVERTAPRRAQQNRTTEAPTSDNGAAR
jgi:hypothetical protein